MKKNRHFMRRFFAIFLGLIAVFWTDPQSPFYAEVFGLEIEIPSSFNPVGSGARAIGMGGAFIAVANDATAASWNPGGLAQLKHPEASMVTSFLHREEDIRFGTNPGGDHSISEENINYLSVTYPFQISAYNMVVSLSYQHLYDFERDWQFTLKNSLSGDLAMTTEDHWDYQQQGRLSAIGLSYCVRLARTFSAGFTLNFWRDGLTDNHWEQRYQMTGSGVISTPLGDEHFTESLERNESYSFKGFNANLGILWNITSKLTMGAVLKTPFKADVEHKHEMRKESSLEPVKHESYTSNEEIEMPMSWGIGWVYNFSDRFSMSADVYRTEWDDYIYRYETGHEINPVSGRLASRSDVEATHQIRMGAEYRYIHKQIDEKGYLVSAKSGIFYDPAPAEGNPDDFYGFALGLGFTNNRFSADIAYQYRFGNDVGSILEDREFSQDVREHTVYLSLILYKF